MDKKLGERIRAMRRLAGMPADAAAWQLGMGEAEYRRIEAGTKSVSLEGLHRIARLYGVKVADITGVLGWNTKGATSCMNTQGHEPYAMIDLFYANKHMAERLQAQDA